MRLDALTDEDVAARGYEIKHHARERTGSHGQYRIAGRQGPSEHQQHVNSVIDQASETIRGYVSCPFTQETFVLSMGEGDVAVDDPGDSHRHSEAHEFCAYEIESGEIA